MSARLLSRLTRLEHMTEAGGRIVYAWLNQGDTAEARTAALIEAGEADRSDQVVTVRWLWPDDQVRTT